MRYNKILFIGLFSLLISGIYSKSTPQTGLLMSVYGYVINLNSEKPISGISIHIIETNSQGDFINVTSGTSDINGFYKVKYLREGTYRFSIQIPENGIIYIGYISSAGSSNDNYDLEIKYGENKNLNLFLGESDRSDIFRKESSDRKIIDVTMILDEDLSSTQPISSFQRSAWETIEDYKGLLINQDQEINILTGNDDNRDLDPDPNKDPAGIYKFDLSNTSDPSYDGNTCILKNPRGKFKGRIQVHSANWLKNKINSERLRAKLPPLSDDCINCLHGCIIKHEQSHMRSSTNAAKFHWDSLLDQIKHPLPANCWEECKNWKFYLEDKWIQNMRDSIKDSEYQANNERDICVQSDCTISCGDVFDTGIWKYIL